MNEYRFETLKNGLKVAASQLPNRDSVAVAIWTKVGSRYETARVSGISHFVEHLLFKGTKNRTTRQIKESIEGLGGVFNAFTGEESTCYFVKILKQHYDLAVEVLADMVLNPIFSPKEINRERTVVLEEIRMYQDQPSQFVHERMSQLLWPNQPLGRFIAGTEETVAKIQRRDFVEFKKKYYHPRNMLMSVCGGVPTEDILRSVQRHFPEKSAGRVSGYKPVIERQRKPRFDFYKKNTEQMHAVMGFHGPSGKSSDRFAFGLLNVILGGNMSSRLFEEVREKRGLSYEIKSSLYTLQDTGSFTISEGVDRKKLALSLRVILKELRKICAKPVSKAELRRARDYYLGQHYLALEDNLDMALWVGEKALYSGKLPDQAALVQKINAVTPEDIQKIAQKYLITRNLNLACIGPLEDKMIARIKKDFFID